MITSMTVVTRCKEHDVTLAGFLPPYRADHSRKFVYGPPEFFLDVPGFGEIPVMEAQAQEAVRLCADGDWVATTAWVDVLLGR